MALRKHRAGELVIEQVRDLARVRAMLDAARMRTHGIEWPASCYLIASIGDDAVGIVGVEPRIDAALIRSLHVNEAVRRRGIATRLVAAARKAAHTRGARSLYLFASPELHGFFERLDFREVPAADLMNAMRDAPEVEYYRAHPGDLAREIAFQLDISNDGVIER